MLSSLLINDSASVSTWHEPQDTKGNASFICFFTVQHTFPFLPPEMTLERLFIQSVKCYVIIILPKSTVYQWQFCPRKSAPQLSDGAAHPHVYLGQFPNSSPALVGAKSLQSHPTLCNAMDCGLPGSSIHGILQARMLEWVAISSSRGSSRPRDGTHASYVSANCRRYETWVGFLPLTPPGKFHPTLVVE